MLVISTEFTEIHLELNGGGGAGCFCLVHLAASLATRPNQTETTSHRAGQRRPFLPVREWPVRGVA